MPAVSRAIRLIRKLVAVAAEDRAAPLASRSGREESRRSRRPGRAASPDHAPVDPVAEHVADSRHIGTDHGAPGPWLRASPSATPRGRRWVERTGRTCEVGRHVVAEAGQLDDSSRAERVDEFADFPLVLRSVERSTTTVFTFRPRSRSRAVARIRISIPFDGRISATVPSVHSSGVPRSASLPAAGTPLSTNPRDFPNRSRSASLYPSGETAITIAACRSRRIV